MRHLLLSIFTLLLLVACKDEPPATTTTEEKQDQSPVKVPAFSKDSAYQFVAQQVAFGPRVPGTDGHKATREWMVQKLKAYGAVVNEQSFRAETATLGSVRAANIIASYNPTYARRVVLAAHWDTRFAADEDADGSDRPHDGADDGGSGVGVLLEIARLLNENPISIGVDIILFDAEDQGTSAAGNESWCLGSQYWGQNPHVKSYRAEYGILLDMVGAKGAVFRKEQLNGIFYPAKVSNIQKVYNKVWALAKGMNKSAYFLDMYTGPVTDDHFFVNLYTDIPMIDIIYKSIENQNGFGSHWHTHEDNMDIIDPNTLGAVGQVVTAFVYNSSKAPL